MADFSMRSLDIKLLDNGNSKPWFSVTTERLYGMVLKRRLDLDVQLGVQALVVRDTIVEYVNPELKCFFKNEE